jgi:hypothetical protein
MNVSPSLALLPIPLRQRNMTADQDRRGASTGTELLCITFVQISLHRTQLRAYLTKRVTGEYCLTVCPEEKKEQLEKVFSFI